MDEEDLFGIDTEVERSRIEYTAQLRYIKDTVLSDQDAEAPSDEVDYSLHQFTIDSPLSAIERLDTVTLNATSLVLELERRLAADVISIDPDEYPAVSTAIKQYCLLNRDDVVYNDNRINFTMYKKALAEESTNPVAATITSAYEDAHSRVDGKIEAELYKTVVGLQDFCSGFQQSLVKSFTSAQLIDIGTSDPKARVEDAQLKINNEWVALDRKRSDLEGKMYSEQDPVISNGYLNELNAVKDKMKGIQASPIVEITAGAHHRITELSDSISRIKSTVLSTVMDEFQGMMCCFIKKFIAQAIDNPAVTAQFNTPDTIHDYSVSVQKTGSKQVDTSKTLSEVCDDIRKVKAGVDQYIKYIEGVKVGLSFLNNGYDLDLKGLLGQFLTILQGPITLLENMIISTYTQLKTTALQPVTDFLTRMAKDPDTQCLPIEALGEQLMNVINGYDQKFKDAMLDFFKLSKYMGNIGSKHITIIKDKKKVKSLYQVVCKIQDILTYISNNLDNFPIGKIESMITQSVKDNGWDWVYDSATDTVTRLVKLDCGGTMNE